MLHILVVTTRPAALQDFLAALTEAGEIDVKLAASGAATLEAATVPPDLVIVDSQVPDTDPLPLIHRLLLANAMINTAVISSLAAEEFHEASEGLGVLQQLPDPPGARDAAPLLDKLRRILGLSPRVSAST